MMSAMSAERGTALRSVRVSVAGQNLALRTDARAGYVRELADYISAKIDAARTLHQERRRAVSPHALALLAALQVADELMQLRAHQRDLEADVRTRSKRILEYLDQLDPVRPAPVRRRTSTDP